MATPVAHLQARAIAGGILASRGAGPSPAALPSAARRLPRAQEPPRPSGGWRRIWAICPCGLLLNSDPPVTKLHTVLLAVGVTFAVLCVGVFEMTRLSAHVLRTPCTVIGNQVQDVGSCTVCDGGAPANCQVHPVATARLAVTFQPLHSSENVTGWVWYCKRLPTEDPCRSQLRFLDQLSLDARRSPFGRIAGPGGHQVSCVVGDVLAYTQGHIADGARDHTCYYSSRDPDGEDVWFSMPSQGLLNHALFERHRGHPILLFFGGLVLITVLLGCLALEGVDL